MILNLTGRYQKLTNLWRVPLSPRFPFDRCISRLEYKPDLFHFSLNCEKVADIIDSSQPLLTWEECCEARAQALMALNKDTYFVSYSGGIDSTCLMVALMKTWPKDFLNRVVVLLNTASINENVPFFEKHVLKFRYRNIMNAKSASLNEKNSIMLTGELGDQLFGSDILAVCANHFGDASLAGDYRRFVPLVMDKWTGLEGYAAVNFKFLEPIVQECPFPIRTTHDFFWWWNFSQKWQYVKFRFLEMDDWKLTGRYGEHILHFFDTVAFQRWSIHNHDLKIKNDWLSYKFAAKEYIYDFTREPSDLHLRKEQSLGKMYCFSRNRIALTEDYEEVPSLEELEKYVRRPV